jgi:hypothetical protein
MNLLDATATLLDFAKTNAHEGDRVIQRAIRRMEKRLFILQVRAAKRRRRARLEAFYQAIAAFRGSSGSRAVGLIPCMNCDNAMGFREFCKGAVFTGSGRIQSLTCNECGAEMRAKWVDGAWQTEGTTHEGK